MGEQSRGWAMARWRHGVARAALPALLLVVLFAGAVPGAGEARAQGLLFLEREPGPQPGAPHDGQWFSYRCGRVQGPAYGCTSIETSAPAVIANVQAAVQQVAADSPSLLCASGAAAQGLTLHEHGDWASVEAPQKYYGYGLPAVQYPFVSAHGEVLETSRDFSIRYQCAGESVEHAFIYQIQKRRMLLCPVGTATLFQGCLLQSASVQPGKNTGACCADNPASNAPKVGNPIHPATGNKYQRESDYRGAGAFALTFTRHYNSFGRVREAGIGRQWRHGHAREVVRRGSTATVYRGDGAAFYVTRGTDGQWHAQADVPLRLAEQVDSAGTLIGWQLQLADDTREDYDAAGRWLRVTNRAGLAQHASYDGEGRLAAVSDDFGRTLSLHYAGERLIGVTEPGGNRIEYTYDAEGRLIEVTHLDVAPAPTLRRYHYEDAAHPYHLTGVTDERGVRAGTWTYDAQGRAIHGERAGGADAVDIAYLPGGAVQVRDALGRSTTHQFQTNLGTVRMAASSGDACQGCPRQAAAIGYDVRGYPASMTDLNGAVTHYGYDVRGLEVSRSEAVGTPAARTVSTQWHAQWRKPVRSEAPGKVTEYEYDAAGRLLSRTERDAATARERRTAYAYNDLGLIASIDGPRTDVADVTTFDYTSGNLTRITNALGHVTALTAHDAHGRVLAMLDANGLESTFAYDARGRLTRRETAGLRTELGYDAAGNLTRVTLPDASEVGYQYDAANRLVAVTDALGNRIEYTLDALGNRTAERVLDAAGALVRTQSRVFDAVGRLIEAIGGEGDVQSYAYDAMGNLLAHTDARGQRSEHAYDALARLVSSQDALGGQSVFSYDARDNLVAITDARGVRTAYGYDGLDDALGELSPDRGSTAYATDAAGNRVLRTDAREISAQYHYDALNRLTAVRYPDPGQDVVYRYDSAPHGIGRLAEVADASGVTAYAYDIRGNLGSETRTVSGHAYPIHYGYDPLDRLASITYPSGMRIDYPYDAAGRVVAVRRSEAGQDTVLAADIAYTGAGQARAWTLGNGLTGQRSFDRDGRVLAIAVPGVLARDYRHDASGNITAIDDALSPQASQAFGYDALDRLTHASGVYGALDYAYDAAGNRASRASPAGVDDYRYETQSNRLLEIAGPNAQVLAYDAAGNTITRGTREDSYDAAGRLQASSLAGAEQVRYAYNARGERVQRITPDGEIHYVFGADGQLLAEADASGHITREHVYLNGAPLALIVRSTAPAPAPSGVFRASGGTWSEPGVYVVEYDANVSRLSVWRDGEMLFHGLAARPFRPGNHVYRAKYGGPDGSRAGVAFVPHTPASTDPNSAPAPRGLVNVMLRKDHVLPAETLYARRYLLYRSTDLVFHELTSEPASASTVYYHHLDHLGTPQALTDEHGTIAWQAHYLPFGHTMETITDIDQPIRFPGQFVDAAAGAIYNYQRWYEPGTGRYLTSDPIGLDGGLHTYAYSLNNPSRYSDLKSPEFSAVLRLAWVDVRGRRATVQ